jgi:hypothetical protein
MANEGKKCAHPACNCTVQGNNKYCSSYCEAASDMPDMACNCGHAGCAAGSGTTMTAES